MRACEGCGQEPAVSRRGQVIDRHDCDYVRRVNATLDHAAAVADSLSPGVWPDGWAWDKDYWSAVELCRSRAGVPTRRAAR